MINPHSQLKTIFKDVRLERHKFYIKYLSILDLSFYLKVDYQLIITLKYLGSCFSHYVNL